MLTLLISILTFTTWQLAQVISRSDCKMLNIILPRWSFERGDCVRVMETVSGAIRSLKFSKSGSYLIAGNEFGQMVIFDVQRAVPLEIIQTCQSKAIWSIDVSWDD